MNRLEFPVEYSFDRENHSVIATVPDLNHISSFGQDFTLSLTFPKKQREPY